MLRKNRDGIAFDDTVYLTEEKYMRFPIYMRLIQVLAIFIGSYCYITILTKCFEIQSKNNWLIASIFISGVVFFALFLYPKYDFFKAILFLAIYGGLVYHKFGLLSNGFYLLENAVISRASAYYGFEEFRYIADYSRALEDITLLLIMIIVPIVALIAISMIRSRLKLLCYIIMLIPAIASFAMGVTPPEADFIAFILFFLFMVISNNLSHAKSSVNKEANTARESMIYRISIRSAYLLCLMVLLLFFIIKQFVSVEAYENYDGIDEAKSNIQEFLLDLQNTNLSDKLSDSNWKLGSSKNASSGGLNLGKLGRIDEVIYDDAEHLLVSAPLESVKEGIYLRGYIGSEYTGDSWETHSRPSIRRYEEMLAGLLPKDYNPVTGTAELLNSIPFNLHLSQGRVDIKYRNANKKYAYAPYFTVFNEKDYVSFEYDLGAVSDRDIEQASYEYSYKLSEILDYTEYDLISALGYLINNEVDIREDYLSAYVTLFEFLENERKYKDFVYETYTKLPEEGLDRLRHDFSREAVGAPSENIRSAIQYVKDYLNRTARYTLAPGKLPKGKDFVEYFLYENKLGYCSHFASAGALMLRAMGYPSRYVEGYAINRSDLMNQAITSYGGGGINTADITVKDSNAHAWVEVYIDGFGWIPVEFTTGSGMEDMVFALGEIYGSKEKEEEQSVSPSPSPTPTPTDRPPSPTPMPKEDIKPSQTPPDKKENTEGSDSSAEKADKPEAGNGWSLTVIVLLILIFAAASYYVLVYRRKEYIRDESYSKRALRLYRKLERLFIINNGLPKRAKSLEDNEDYAKENLRLLPVEDFALCMEIVRKARFGRASISVSEYMRLASFYEALRDKIYENLPNIKKLYFKLAQEMDNI